MNELDLAVLHRASTHGLHSVSMLLDANDAITVTVTSPTPKTTMKSIIRIENNAPECSFSFSEKELKHGGKIELTSHIIHCETLTDVIQILDKFSHHLRAAYIDPDALKMHLVAKKDKIAVTSGKISGMGSAEIGDIRVQLVGRSTTPAPVPPSPPAYVWDAPQPVPKGMNLDSIKSRFPETIPGEFPAAEEMLAPAKKEDDLPFNTDLDEEDKP